MGFGTQDRANEGLGVQSPQLFVFRKFLRDVPGLDQVATLKDDIQNPVGTEEVHTSDFPPALVRGEQLAALIVQGELAEKYAFDTEVSGDAICHLLKETVACIFACFQEDFQDCISHFVNRRSVDF